MFARFVWSLAYFVILLCSCSFLHMLESIAHSLRANSSIPSTAGRDLQCTSMGHPKLHPHVTAYSLAGLKMYHSPHTWMQSQKPGGGALLQNHCLCPVAFSALCTALEWLLLPWGKGSVSLWEHQFGAPWCSLISSDMLAAPADSCLSLHYSLGISCPASLASFMALPPCQTGKVISSFCTHSGISFAQGTSFGSAVRLGTAPCLFSPHQP